MTVLRERSGEFWFGAGVIVIVVVLLFLSTLLIFNYQNTERDKRVSEVEACTTIENIAERSVCLRGVS